MSTIEADTRPDLTLMERWAGWMCELLHQAAEGAGGLDGGRTQETLVGAADDADALRRVLEAAIAGGLDDELTTALRSIYALWEGNQERYERLAAEVDPEAHRQWTIRSAATRLLCERIEAPGH